MESNFTLFTWTYGYDVHVSHCNVIYDIGIRTTTSFVFGMCQHSMDSIRLKLYPWGIVIAGG